MDYKRSKAVSSTITRDLNNLEEPTGNIYEAIMVIAKRSNQISVELKFELNRKLEEFTTVSDSLEEVFENREQIEISRFYERLPKPTLMALQEWEDEEIYFRRPEPSVE